jgi:hypothetical protein
MWAVPRSAARRLPEHGGLFGIRPGAAPAQAAQEAACIFRAQRDGRVAGNSDSTGSSRPGF